MIVQIYEIQEPREAERLIEMGVDRIGSVILSPEAWKNPSVRWRVETDDCSDL